MKTRGKSESYGLDANLFETEDLVLESFAVDPVGLTGARIWFNSTEGTIKYYDGATTKVIMKADAALIKTMYESNADTNAFTDAAASKVTDFDTEVENNTAVAANTAQVAILTGDILAVATTGLDTGGFLTPNVDPTLFDISDGTGFVNDGTTIHVEWSGLVGLTATFRLTDSVSFVAIDETGTVIQQTSDFTIEERRDLIVLGTLVHVGTDISGGNDNSHAVDTYLANDLAIALGNINEDGNNYNPASTDLTIRKEAGISFLFNANRDNNPKDPNNLTSGVEDPVTFLTVYDDGSGGTTVGAPTTIIDPNFYDDGSGTLAAVTGGGPTNSIWTNQIIYYFPQTNITIVRYGTELFTKRSDAEEAAGNKPDGIGTGFNTALVRTVISIKKATTDLSLTDNTFSSTGKFGLEGGGGTGIGGTLQDLQDVYDHSTSPEMVTDATRGALTVQGGTGDDIDTIYEGKNNAGITTFIIDGQGRVTARSADIIHVAESDDDHALEIIVDAAGYGDIKAVDIDYITGSIGSGGSEGIILLNIDESAATGGCLFGYEVLTTTVGGVKVVGLKTGVGVDPVEQFSGIFEDITTILNKAVHVQTELSQGGAGNISAFVADNDTFTIGSAAKFQELEFILSQGADKAQGIKAVFEFSTGVGTWAVFTPTDGTNGFKNTGDVLWDEGNIPTWVVGTGTEFLIRITRTENNNNTIPILELVQGAAPALYNWNKDGGLSVDTVKAIGTPSYDDDAAAGVGGLLEGEFYQTTGSAAAPLNAAGILMIKQ